MKDDEDTFWAWFEEMYPTECPDVDDEDRPYD